MSNIIVQFDKTPSGYGEYRLAPVEGKLLGWVSGVLTNVENSPGATTFTGLTDAASADLPTVNTPLKNALAGKANLSGAVFTGTVTATGGITTAKGVRNTNIATVAGSTYTPVSGDLGGYRKCINAVGTEIIIENGLGQDGDEMILVGGDSAGPLSLTPGTSVSIYGGALAASVPQGGLLGIKREGPNTWRVVSDATTNANVNAAISTNPAATWTALGGGADLLIFGGHEWFLAPLTTAGSRGTGMSSGGFGVVGVTANAGAQAGAAAAAYVGDMAWSHTASSGQNWPLDRRCEIVVTGIQLYFFNSGINRKCRILVGRLGAPNLADAQALPGAGFGVEFWLESGQLKGALVWRGTGETVVGASFGMGPWNNKNECLGSARIVHDGAGAISFYMSPIPAVPGRGMSPLPATPTATILAAFGTVNAGGRYVSLEAANHTSDVSGGIPRIISRAVYIKAASA